MKHKHSELIKAWADGAIIQYYDGIRGEFVDEPENAPDWDVRQSYRVKPEIRYPASTLTWNDFANICDASNGPWNSYHCELVADAAIKHAIITGQVILPEENQ